MSNRGRVFKQGSSYGYYFSYTYNGKRKQVKKQGFKQQRLAQQALTKALAEIDGGRLVGADKQTVENFLCSWVKDYERSQTVKASTVETTKIHIDKYLIPGIGAVRLSALNVKTIETYLPNKSVSLLNLTARNINLKTLKVGSKVDIRYDFSLETYASNTEVWIRTLLKDEDASPTGYVGLLKYQYSYDISYSQTIFINSDKIKNYGGQPQIRTDNESSFILKGIYVSVS